MNEFLIGFNGDQRVDVVEWMGWFFNDLCGFVDEGRLEF